MTRKEFEIYMDECFEKIQDLRIAGQKEYAHEEDNCFANFERVANYLGIDRERVLATYLVKHIDGITAHLRGHRSQREPVTGRIDDAIVYLFLLRGMIDEATTNTISMRNHFRNCFVLDREENSKPGAFKSYRGDGYRPRKGVGDADSGTYSESGTTGEDTTSFNHRG